MTPFRHRLVGVTSQLANFHKADPQRYFHNVDWYCRPRPTNAGPDLLRPFKTPPQSQVYTFSTPGSSVRPSSLSRDF
ncbi:hypothetical protein BASA60_005825 [Batrachochytrium salamandrivorans]|nr:hypothetical protein BASA60_005825 [Batrachochytrium salamandrivorans]